MRLLLNLISSLTDDEAAKLSALNLRGKQRALMNLVFSKRECAKLPTIEETAGLRLSDSHLYEISSVVLSKCHHVLVPEGGIALLEFLTYKNARLQFKQELRKQKKKWIHKKGKDAENFFLACFELLHRFTNNLIDSGLIEEYGKLYLSAKTDATEEDRLAIKAQMLQLKLSRILGEGKNFHADQAEVFRELSELERAAKNSSHPYFCYSVYSALAWYWGNLGEKPERSLEYLKLAAISSKKLEGYVFRDMALEMELRIASAQFHLGSVQEAHEIFEKTYAALRPDHALWRRNRFLFGYLEVLIYNNRHARAEKILQQRFEPLFKLRPTTASATAASLFSILYLFNGDYPKAKRYLDIGIELNAKTNFTLYNEVRNRYIEACYYYLTGNWDYTLELTHRAMQYLRGKHIGLNKHNFGYYFKIIDASIAFYSQGIPFWHKLEEKYTFLTSPAEGLFGKLLEKIRDTPKAKIK